jgi:hypothetical protein
VTWAALLARCEPRLAASRPRTWTRSCTFGFAAWAVVQGVVALLAVNGSEIVRILGLSLYLLALVPFFLTALLAQAVLAPLLLLLGTDYRLPDHLLLSAAVFVATLLCGLPNLAGGLFTTNLIELLRRPVVTSPRRRPGSVGIGRST